jgi:hypothetical protein
MLVQTPYDFAQHELIEELNVIEIAGAGVLSTLLPSSNCSNALIYD